MTEFEKTLIVQDIKIKEVDEFFKSKNITWDKTDTADESFFDIYPVSLRYRDGKKVFHSYVYVNKYDFILYHSLTSDDDIQTDLSYSWMAFRLKNRPELFEEYRTSLSRQLSASQKIKERVQKDLKEDYEEKREKLDKDYKRKMEESEISSQKLANYLRFVNLEEKNLEEEM